MSDATMTYLAGTKVSDDQLTEWAERFARDGYLLIPNVLPRDWTAELRADLDRACGEDTHFQFRMFEHSEANRRLFDVEPIVSLAEKMLGEECHVIHNNSFRTFNWTISDGMWHQDDPPHYIVTEGEPPKNVRLPVLWFTCNYYLSDVTEDDLDGTEVIPGSHLFGRPCPPSLDGTEYEPLIEHNVAPEGSVVLFDNQTWHRGGPNRGLRMRYLTQITYGRRMIGHRYFPFMNYQMPEHVYRDADPRLKRLLGFLPPGPYG